MSLPAQEPFTGAAGDLTGYTIWNLLGRTMAKDGTGLGRVSASAGAGDAIVLWPTATDTFPNDQHSQITAKFTGPANGNDYIYLVVRASSQAGTGSEKAYWFWSDGGSDTALNKDVNGTVTSIGTANATTYVSGDIFDLTANGTTISVTKNGVSIISVTDSAVTSGQAGFGGEDATGSGLRVDDWLGNSLAAADTLMAQACL